MGVSRTKFHFGCVLFFISAIAVLPCSAQKNSSGTGYKIKAAITGLNDTLCYLANYFGDKTYVTDTAVVDSKGKFTFSGDSALPGGIYIIAGQSNNKYLELIIDKEQFFSFHATMPEIAENIQFENSRENTLFFEFIQFNMATRKQIDKLRKEQEKFRDQPDSLAMVLKKTEELDLNLEEFQQEVIINHPESFVSVLIKAMKEPVVRNIPLLPDGREDSVLAFIQYKDHYWDNFDLGDDRLLRTPLFHKRIERYFRDLVYQRPDSITREADALINKSRGSKEVFKYMIWYLTYKYETSKVMGFDEIFVHMIDTYYTTGEAFWTDSTTIKTLEKRAEALRPILIGKKAPELILLDTAGSFLSLYHTPAKFMIILFYEADCSHCRKEINELKAWYETDETGAQVFAICTDTSLVKWEKFIIENDLNWINVNATRSITRDYHDLYDISMTPTMFVLDDRKNIIAKRLKADQLKTFLSNYINNPDYRIKN